MDVDTDLIETIMDLLQIALIIALVFLKDRSFAFTLKELFGNLFNLRDEEKTERYSLISLLRNEDPKGVPVEPDTLPTSLDMLKKELFEYVDEMLTNEVKEEMTSVEIEELQNYIETINETNTKLKLFITKKGFDLDNIDV